jgi:hypothetical protein
MGLTKMNTHVDYEKLGNIVANLELVGKAGKISHPVHQMRSIDALFKSIPPVDTDQTIWQRTQSIYIKRKLACAKPEWADSVFIPTQVWMGILEPFSPALVKHNLDRTKFNAMFAQLSCLATWRYSQGVYRVDPYTYKQLFNVNSGSIVSLKHIKNFPEWCIYIETPRFHYLGRKVHGVLVQRNYINDFDRTKEPDALIISLDMDTIFDAEEDTLNPAPYAVFKTDATNDLSIVDAFAFGYAGIAKIGRKTLPSDYLFWNPESVTQVFGPVFSLINLICEKSINVESENYIGVKPSYKNIEASFVSMKGGKPNYKLQAPSNPRMFSVAAEIGMNKRLYDLRKAQGMEYSSPEIEWFINMNAELEIKLPLYMSINELIGLVQTVKAP